eukprot:684506-Pelagomonas_calceolata.AAC.1
MSKLQAAAAPQPLAAAAMCKACMQDYCLALLALLVPVGTRKQEPHRTALIFQLLLPPERKQTTLDASRSCLLTDGLIRVQAE